MIYSVYLPDDTSSYFAIQEIFFKVANEYRLDSRKDGAFATVMRL